MSNNLGQAIAAIRSGDQETGKRLLAEVIRNDPGNEAAWLWMSAVIDSDEHRRTCLERVLAINPHNETARRGLEGLRQKAAENAAQVEVPPQPAPPVVTNALQQIRRIDQAATKKCPYCAETIKAEAVVCRFCGRDLRALSQPSPSPQAPSPSAAKAPQRAQSASYRKLPSSQSKPKRGGGGRWLLVILAVLVTVVCCGGVLLMPRNDSSQSSPSSPQPTRTPTPDRGDSLGACLICKDFVEERLVSPRSAEFPSCSEAKVAKVDSDTWEVISYVEAQNRMGVMLKANYVCEVTYVGNERWVLDDIYIEE